MQRPAPSRESGRRVRVAIATLVTVAGVLAGPGLAAGNDGSGPTEARYPPLAPKILVYGDSLIAEAQFRIESSIHFADPTAEVTLRSFGGTALCDWLPQMRSDAVLRPDVVVIEFAGNAMTPCMLARGTDERDVRMSYLLDAMTAAAYWIAGGQDTEVVIVGTPPRAVAPFLPERNPLDAVYQFVAAANGPRVSFRGAPEAALAATTRDDSGAMRFPRELPCTPGERAMPACRDGEIVVRANDGLHFCPVPGTEVGRCGVYAAGVVRFGDAVAEAALDALGSRVALVNDRSVAAP